MSPLLRLLASFIALMMAMGIGRFALTPQLPHLISEGQVDLTAAGLIAAANYLGYFIGALDAMFARRPAQVRLRLLGGLWLCVLLTLASFWAQGFWAHLLLRFGTGLASAWVLVMITALSQPLALAAGRPRLGALVFAGPGLGIMLTGLLALGANLLGQSSANLWLLYGAVALLMLLAILPILPRTSRSQHAAPPPSAENEQGVGRLGLVYGLYGVGYIIPATFLSQMASARFHGQWQADSFLARLRPGRRPGSGPGQPAPTPPGQHSALADGDPVAAGRGGLACLLGSGLGRGPWGCCCVARHSWPACNWSCSAHGNWRPSRPSAMPDC